MKIISLSIIPILLASCVASTPVKEVSDLTIQVAEYKLMLAQQNGGSWINTPRLLEEAKSASAEGRHLDALTLARQARFEGEAAVRQNEKQQHAIPWQF